MRNCKNDKFIWSVLYLWVTGVFLAICGATPARRNHWNSLSQNFQFNSNYDHDKKTQPNWWYNKEKKHKNYQGGNDDYRGNHNPRSYRYYNDGSGKNYGYTYNTYHNGNWQRQDEDEPPFKIPMMGPIRRFYHAYEDNVRDFAKRFRTIVYAPMRRMMSLRNGSASTYFRFK